MSDAKKTAYELIEAFAREVRALVLDGKSYGPAREALLAALLAAEKRGLERAAEALDRAEPHYCTELYRRGIRQAAKIIRALPVSAPDDATRGT